MCRHCNAMAVHFNVPSCRVNIPTEKNNMARSPKNKDAKTDVTPPVDETGEAPRFPLFYTSPRPLEAGRHAKTTLSAEVHAEFAAKANAIPLNIVEFAIAARHYPLVFPTPLRSCRWRLRVCGQAPMLSSMPRASVGRAASMCRLMSAAIPSS